MEVWLKLRSWAKIFPEGSLFHFEGFSRLGRGEDGFYDWMNRTGPDEFDYFIKVAGLTFIPCKPYHFAFSDHRRSNKIREKERGEIQPQRD